MGDMKSYKGRTISDSYFRMNAKAQIQALFVIFVILVL